MRRAGRRRLGAYALRLLGGCALLGCAWIGWAGCTGPPPGVPRSLAALWRDYRALPGERAFALAGDPGSPRWVAGFAGGHPQMRAAEAAALKECWRRRGERRLQAPCLLYARGDQVVWRQR